MPTTTVTAGARIGDYIVERMLLDGSYDAVHVLLPRKVRLTVGARPVNSVRMMREACILEALRHPGVPRVFEVGMLAAGSHEPWVASEIIGGDTLLDTTMKVGRLQIREVLEVIRDTAEVLAYAHKRGVAHRGVLLDAIVRPSRADVAMRGFPLVLVNWSDACLHDSIDDDSRLFADDVFALGLVADLVIASRTAAPHKLARLVDDMLSPDPLDRPAAAEVAVRAKLILDGLDVLTDEDIVEENVVLVDISRPTPPPLPLSAARMRTRWTPPIGMNTTPSQGVVVGVINLKSRS